MLKVISFTTAKIMFFLQLSRLNSNSFAIASEKFFPVPMPVRFSVVSVSRVPFFVSCCVCLFTSVKSVSLNGTFASVSVPLPVSVSVVLSVRVIVSPVGFVTSYSANIADACFSQPCTLTAITEETISCAVSAVTASITVRCPKFISAYKSSFSAGVSPKIAAYCVG